MLAAREQAFASSERSGTATNGGARPRTIARARTHQKQQSSRISGRHMCPECAPWCCEKQLRPGTDHPAVTETGNVATRANKRNAARGRRNLAVSTPRARTLSRFAAEFASLICASRGRAFRTRERGCHGPGATLGGADRPITAVNTREDCRRITPPGWIFPRDHAVCCLRFTNDSHECPRAEDTLGSHGV